MTTGTVIYTAIWQVWEMLASLLCDKYWDVVHPYWNWLPDGNCSWLGLAWYLGRNDLDNGFRWMFLRYRYKSYMTSKG